MCAMELRSQPRLTLDELQVLLRLVQNETVSREFAAQWARERCESLRARRIACWPPQETDRIRRVVEVVAVMDRSEVA